MIEYCFAWTGLYIYIYIFTFDWLKGPFTENCLSQLSMTKFISWKSIIVNYMLCIFLLSQVLVYKLHSVPFNFFAWHFHYIWFAQKLLTLLHIWKSFMNTTELVVLYHTLSVAELILFFKDVSHFVCVTCNLQASAGHGCMIWIVSCLALWNVYKYGRC